MSHNYIVTSNRASAVSDSVVANFTAPGDINLITAKLSRIEITKVTPDGLKLVKEFGVYGRIEAVRAFRPPGYEKDLLFLLTKKLNVAILDYSDDVRTLRHGNIADPACRPAESGNIVIIEPACKIIGLRMYDGLFKIIPIDLSKTKTDELEAFNIRMEEIEVPDITFLYGFNNPTIGFIFKDAQTGVSHVKTYEISLKEREFILGPWQKDNVANEANMIIPVALPFGGAIIVSMESIVYINNDREITIAPTLMKHATINCYAPIDKNGSRYLLGDISGRLFCLILEARDVRLDSNTLDVMDMKLELYGETSIPECITYIDNAITFIGSRLGDSQLIKLLKEPDENGSLLQVCETYPNLGPITDMCLVDLEKQGQGQLVTCSGHSKDGSLRIIRNGIGINEHTTIKYKDKFVGVWALKVGPEQHKDNCIFVSMIIKPDPEDDNTEYDDWRAVSGLWHCEDDGSVKYYDDDSAFVTEERTILCANVAHNQIIQVHRFGIRLINATDKSLSYKWTFEGGTSGFFRTAFNDNYIACAEGGKLIAFKVGRGELIKIHDRVLETKINDKQQKEVMQIAGMDLTPLTPEKQFLSVAFWFDQDLVIYSWPELTEVYRETGLNYHISYPPRSIVTTKLQDYYYLLLALSDGSVYYFRLDPITGHLFNSKKVTLGTSETNLKPFKSRSTTGIFVCSDRPTVIYSSNNKLVFSNVNSKAVDHMCCLDSVCFSDSLALVSDNELLLGTIDDIQKLHIKTIPLSESPLKISHQQSTQTFGLLTLRIDMPDINGLQPVRPSASTQALSKSSAVAMSTSSTRPVVAGSNTLAIETTNLLIIDQHTFQVLHAHQFMPTEQAVSILSARLGENQEEFFIVGTAFVNDDEPEAKQGRLVVFQWSNTSGLQQVAELNIKGCAYSLCEFDNGKFLAGINASVNLVELNSRRDLHIECSYASATIALYLRRKGDLIVMGDLMRSISLYTYKALQTHFEELARDLNPSWLTDIDILDEETFIGAEHQSNIFVLRRDSRAANEQDRAILNQVGMFHLGDYVNVFHQGSLVVQHPGESSIDIKRATLFGTIEGVVGLILTIDEELYRRLESIQASLTRVVKSVGKIDHSEWRAFQSNKSSQRSVGFIDGDLVETFLDLGRDKMELVARDTDLPLDELIRIIEELNRLH